MVEQLEVVARMAWRRPDFSQRGAFVVLTRFVALMTAIYALSAGFVWLAPLGERSLGTFLIIHGLLTVLFATAVTWVRVIKPASGSMIAFREDQLAHVVAVEREAANHDFDARFATASDLADTEEDSYDVVRRGLRQLVPLHPAELLMADSSEANLRSVTIAGPNDHGPGCPVSSPSRCAAVRASRTVLYQDSDALDACPHLRGRPGMEGCSAVCVPVTVLGRSIGVLHAVGEQGNPPGVNQVRGLETIARVAGARIGMVRVLSEMGTAAGNDPLTGLINRRQLEDRVRVLLRSDVDFAIVMADLDDFKQLNEMHGHEMGDLVLRLFADVCAKAVRPDDVVSRYGGEEFVLIFPGTDPPMAAKALQRVRDALTIRLAGSEVPAFTCSYGMASSRDGQSLDEMLLVADRALHQAKDAGRDRIVIAGSAVSDPLDEFDDLPLG